MPDAQRLINAIAFRVMVLGRMPLQAEDEYLLDAISAFKKAGGVLYLKPLAEGNVVAYTSIYAQEGCLRCQPQLDRSDDDPNVVVLFHEGHWHVCSAYNRAMAELAPQS